MTTQTNPIPIEIETYQIGVASIVLNLLKRLGIAEIIDSLLKHQPEIGVSYGTLAQVVIINHLSFDPQPLYALCEWAERHGIDRLLGIDAAWLDDDRMGALMEGLSKHAAEIWLKVIVRAVKHFGIVLEWLHADTTSVYFEGRYEDEQGQPLKEANAPKLVEGYNKDGKPKNIQMVLSLITHQRVPLWYHPWNGNQSDDGVHQYSMLAVYCRNLIGPSGRGSKGSDTHQVPRTECERLPIFVYQLDLPTGRRQGGHDPQADRRES